MSTPPDPRRQRRIRILLIVGMLVSGLGLFAVLQAGPLAGTIGLPALARSTVRVRILDVEGQPVRHADAFLLAASNDSPAQAAWNPDTGELTLSVPAGGTPSPRSVKITARGYRTREVTGIRTDQIAVLERGLQIRLLLLDMPREALPKHVRVLLRVRPAEVDPNAAGASEVIDLMDNLGGPGSGPMDIPRGGFGYAVSLAQAQAGVIVPEPGPYHVHWGLIDTRANTWFSLGKRCGRVFEVRDTAEVQTFALAMTYDHLQQTLKGLAAGVKQLTR